MLSTFGGFMDEGYCIQAAGVADIRQALRDNTQQEFLIVADIHVALGVGDELRLSDGTMIFIDCTAVENEVADNMYQRSELDWLSYNAPLEYADLILNGDPEKYLKAVTVHKPFEN